MTTIEQSFEDQVLAKLDAILENQSALSDRLDAIDEAIANVSTPGSGYSVFEA